MHLFFQPVKEDIRPLSALNGETTGLYNRGGLLTVNLQSVPANIQEKIGFDIGRISAAAELAGIAHIDMHDYKDGNSGPEALDETHDLMGSLIEPTVESPGPIHQPNLSISDIPANAGYRSRSITRGLGRLPLGLANPQSFSAFDLEIGLNQRVLREMVERTRINDISVEAIICGRNDPTPAWAKILNRSLSDGIRMEGAEHTTQPRLVDGIAQTTLITIQAAILIRISNLLQTSFGVDLGTLDITAIASMLAMIEWPIINHLIASKKRLAPYCFSFANISGAQIDRTVLLQIMLADQKLVHNLKSKGKI